MGFLEEAQKLRQREAESNIQNKGNMEIINELEQIQVSNMVDKKQKEEEMTKELYRRAIENIKIGNTYENAELCKEKTPEGRSSGVLF